MNERQTLTESGASAADLRQIEERLEQTSKFITDYSIEEDQINNIEALEEALMKATLREIIHLSEELDTAREEQTRRVADDFRKTNSPTPPHATLSWILWRVKDSEDFEETVRDDAELIIQHTSLQTICEPETHD